MMSMRGENVNLASRLGVMEVIIIVPRAIKSDNPERQWKTLIRFWFEWTLLYLGGF